MDDPRDPYQKAMQDRETAQRDANKLVEKLASVAKRLSDEKWTRVALPGASIPDVLTINSATPRIDSEQWPKIEQMADAISRFHIASLAAVNAWEEIPLEKRYALCAPPSNVT